MGKHRYKHSSQIRPTCANRPAQGRCKFGKFSFSSMCLPLQVPGHPVQNAFLGYKRGILPSAELSVTGVCRTGTIKGTSMQVVHLCCSKLDRRDGLPITTNSQGYNGPGCKVPVLCPVHLTISLLLCTCWKFSPSLLATCLSVFKHKAKITSNLPFLLSLFFVFIHAPCLRHLPYCTDHHTVFLSQCANIRL